MKKLVVVAIGLLVLVNAGAVAYKMGWLARQNPSALPAGSAAGQPPTAPNAPGASGQAGPGRADTPAAVSSPAGATPAQPAPPSGGAAPGPPVAPPPFDGNVASIVWGGRVESVTGEAPGSDWTNDLIAEKSSWYRTAGAKAPVDIVISFFRHEPVLVSSATVVGRAGARGVKDFEIWTSTTGPDSGFVKAADGSIARNDNPFSVPEASVRFPPVQARFAKIRLVRTHEAFDEFQLCQVRILEAQAPGYVPLLTRHPEIAAPTFVAEGLAAASSQPPPVTGCAPAAAPPLQPGTGESKKVLLVVHNYLGANPSYVPFSVQSGRLPKSHTSSREDLSIFDRVETKVIQSNHAHPWMLADVDTVLMEQVCDMTWFAPQFLPSLTAWVAAGHKLIIHDSDKCASGPDYRWMPYRFKASIPGAMGEPGKTFRILENTWMLNDLHGRPGYVDGAAWAQLRPPANELGDSNVITDWGPGWCGQVAVRNALGAVGFSQAYAHYGRGLILWEGLDVDMTGTTWLDVIRARQLAQGFNTDNLACSVKVGSFVVVTEPRLFSRGVQAGQSYTYPLSVLPNLKYKGTVNLTTTMTPAAAGLGARIEPATVTVAGEQTATMTVTVPAAAKPGAMAIEVKGTDAEGKTSSLCLQLGPVKSGELGVVSTLSPPTKSRKNLEFILDASGSMKTMLGKKSRWDTALDTLADTLAKLPDDFNVGLRIYGHRELSTSPKTCTDSQLVVPVRTLDRAAILKAAKVYKPKGETPLVYSAMQAPADLKAVGGGTVILITDGEESCKGDPVKAAADLKASGLDIKLNIVGFALTNPKTQRDLAGFSQATGGLFYAAQSGQALGDALMVAAIDKFPYAIFDGAGKQVASGEAGWPAEELPLGDYKVVVKVGAKELVAPRVKVTLGQTTMLKIAFRNNQLVLE